MADITMCHGLVDNNGVLCTPCVTCARRPADPSDNWQSYFVDPPVEVVNNQYRCNYYAKEVL